MDAEVSAGEVLYLPAGWFHEVTSMSTPTTSTTPAAATGTNERDNKETTRTVTKTAGGGGGGHLALNYWFHPPVGEGVADHPSAYNFENPYGSEARQRMWETDWAMWEELFDAEKKNKIEQ